MLFYLTKKRGIRLVYRTVLLLIFFYKATKPKDITRMVNSNHKYNKIRKI